MRSQLGQLWFLLAVTGSLATMAQEAAIISEPEGDYLLEVTREWSDLAGLGDLKGKPLGKDDVELRVWGGYGLAGTKAAILRRIGGKWEGLTLDVKQFIAAETDLLAAVEGVLPPCVVEAMASRCRIDTVKIFADSAVGNDDGGLLYQLECPHLQNAPEDLDQASYEQLWEKLVKSGVLTLPPRVERDWIMVDGHSYVIEVRKGSHYRALTIEHTTPEVEADRQVQAIAKRVDEMLHASIYSFLE